MSSPNRWTPLPEIWVFDSSALLDTRRNLPQARQVRLLNLMAEMVRNAQLFFPVQVHREMTSYGQTDRIANWVNDVELDVARHYRPPDAVMREVERRFPILSDPDKRIPDADPFVVAQALALKRELRDVCVVHRDVVNRSPRTTSIASALNALDIPWMQLPQFLAEIKFGPDPD